ncbi:MAG: EscU/YscU/HrcU family type III secretion system export apparatus switch protein [Myxococcota bacterium]|jgi:flagellar biosynthetic protein FlhB|nr:EscU/YscU/HrcU family type III secretion system export apparatus switch protein [Myxococcota bacterium]
MAENQDGQEKVHDPSEKRLKDAAEEGQIAQSKEIGSAMILLAGAASLVFFNGPLAQTMRTVAEESFTIDPNEQMEIEHATQLGAQSLIWVGTAIIIPLAFLFVAALVSGLMQTGFNVSPKALQPKVERINLFKNFKQNYLSSMPIVELAKGLVKLFALGLVTWLAVGPRLSSLPAMSAMEPTQLLIIMVELGWRIILFSLPLLVVIATLDYSYQWWRNKQQLMMTEREVKDERKEMEGDPIVRAARRARQRQYAMGNMLARIRDADVLITNPTHYAVALRYRKDEAPAPVIIGMGVDHVALLMRKEALKHDVLRIENRKLARALHAKGKVDHMIPDEFYGAVAQVLAVVYRKRAQRRMNLGLPPGPPPGG